MIINIVTTILDRAVLRTGPTGLRPPLDDEQKTRLVPLAAFHYSIVNYKRVKLKTYFVFGIPTCIKAPRPPHL